MCSDPILDETRKLRDAYAAQFDYDIDAMVNDLKQLEQVNKTSNEECKTPSLFGAWYE